MQFKAIAYDWGGLNEKIFYLINHAGNPASDALMLLASHVGEYRIFPVYGVIIGIIAWYDLVRVRKPSEPPHRLMDWGVCLATLLVAYLLSLLWVMELKETFQFPRPFAALPEGSVRIMDSVRLSEDPLVSFPSGHTSFATLMAAGLWPLLGGYGRGIAVLLVLWVGISRISLGVHFPADVAGSIVLSALATLAVRTILVKTLFRPRKMQA